MCLLRKHASFNEHQSMHNNLRARWNSTCSILICPQRCCARSEAACCSALLILPLGGGVRADTSKAWLNEVAGHRKASTMADMSPCTSLHPRMHAHQTLAAIQMMCKVIANLRLHMTSMCKTSEMASCNLPRLLMCHLLVCIAACSHMPQRPQEQHMHGQISAKP